ncbi:MAG: hypothetical protein EOP67_10275 [Sphingomonas sp.]|nr:MAG: hypothetical protein EOP67_10275 [Sphingomonas sp.]
MSTAPKPRARPAPAPSNFNVRQVTNAQASWRAQAGKEGAFELQLILDHGAAEHILPMHAAELKAVLQLLGESARTMFDSERGLLLFSDLKLG